MGFVLDHAWQSTLFTMVAALLAWTLRRYHARVRYAVWLAASIKFLIPYALLVAGAHLVSFPTMTVPLVATPGSAVFFDTADAVAAPFQGPPQIAVRVASATPSSKLPLVFMMIWLAGTLTLIVRWMAMARRFNRPRIHVVPISLRERDVLARISAQTATVGVDVALIDSGIEPGIAGVFNPALFWPRGISDRLTDQQVDAVVAHEMAHVAWRDNAAAMTHMVVEALFWFHPLVWWLGARLIDERERGCDEAVLRAGREREAYAEGILRICEFHVSSPLSCFSGVTGSDLKRRIEAIMRGEIGRGLSRTRQVLLAGFMIAAVGLPVGLAAFRTEGPSQVLSSKNLSTPVATTPTQVGVESNATRFVEPPVQRPAVPAPRPSAPPIATLDASVRFGVVSIKQTPPGPLPRGAFGFQRGGHFFMGNVTPLRLVQIAYHDQGHTGLPIDLVDATHVPAWASQAHYNIEARAAGDPDAAPLSMDGAGMHMLQTMLAERFAVKVHTEKRVVPVWALVTARSDGRLGPRLRPTTAYDCDAILAALRDDPQAKEPPPPTDRQRCALTNGSDNAHGGSVLLDTLAIALRSAVDAPIVDHTGLSGRFDIDLQWSVVRPGDTAISEWPAIFTAVEEQLGLKLERRSEARDILVIDLMERPTEN